MDAKSKPVLNGGSGGLSNGPQTIVVGAGGLKAPEILKKQKARKLLLICILVAAANAAPSGGNSQR